MAVTAGATTSGINFGLATGGRITGTVTDAATGAPLSGVSVNVYDASGSFTASTSTNASGVYLTTQGLLTGSYRVQTSNSLGYINEAYYDIPCVNCSSTTGTLVAVTAGTTTSGINFGLATGGRITGTVTDAATGAPLSGVEVDVYTESGSYVTYSYTDASGVYLEQGLPTGSYRVVTNSSLGYLDEAYDNIPCLSCSPTTGAAVAVTAGATTSGINFALAAGGRLTGTVTDVATGALLSGVSVSVYDASGSFVASASTNASGVYLTTRGLPTGSYRVRTSNSLGYINEAYNNIPCLNCSSTTGTLIGVTAGATTSGINFGLATGGRITGTVTDAATGAPLSGVTVRVYTEAGTSVTSVTTDASGVYLTTQGLPTGSYRVRTSNSLGYLDKAYNNIPCLSCGSTSGTLIAVTAGATTAGIDFGLAVGGRITGVVTDAATGVPVSGVSVYIYDASGSFIASRSTNASVWYLTGPGLPTGSYRVQADFNSLGYVSEAYDNIPCMGCSSTTGTPVAVTAGTTTSGINFKLALGGRISGAVTDAVTGAPLASVSVRCTPRPEVLVTSVTTDGTGVYTTYEGLVAGSYRLRTSNSLGYVDEIYDNVVSPNLNATTDLSAGALVVVTDGATTSGINVGLSPGGDHGYHSRYLDRDGPGQHVGPCLQRHRNARGHGVCRRFWRLSHLRSPGWQLSRRLRSVPGLCQRGVRQHPVRGLRPGDHGRPGRGDGRSHDTRDQLRPGNGGAHHRCRDERCDGSPAVRVGVDVYTEAGVLASATSYTDASGVYLTSAGLVAGNYRVRTVSASGYIGEAYDNVVCLNCAPSVGATVAVVNGATTSRNQLRVVGWRAESLAW